MNNIVQTLRTPFAGRRPTARLPGELYFNFGDRIIGCIDAAGNPVDIATAIPVDTTAPANPVPGMLWLNTGEDPAVLQVFAGATAPEPWVTVTAPLTIATEEQAIEGLDNEAVMTPLRVAQAIAAQAGDGAATHVGDTPPAEPEQGQLWFRTITPVGLFVWYEDGDSSQWVQIGGGGPAFATTAEARAGSRNDVVMSPALVQARSGVQVLDSAGQTALTFNQVPNEATEIDLTFNGLNYNSGRLVFLDFAGAPGARAWSTRVRSGATYTPPAGDDDNSRFVLDLAPALSWASGLIKLSRNAQGGVWFIDGSLRFAVNNVMHYTGIFNLYGTTVAQLRINSDGPFIGGWAHARWRI